jgi:hypothetical protein
LRQILPRWWRAHFLPVEFWLSALLTIAAAWWLSVWNKNSFLDGQLFGVRSGLYAVLATVWGALLGFVIATITILLGFSESPRMKIVRESDHYQDLWNTFKSATWVLGFATVASIGGLLGDKDSPGGHPNHFISYVVLFATTLASLRLARCIWILHRVVGIVTKRQADASSAARAQS